MFGCCSKSFFTNYHMVLKRVVLRNLKLSSFLVFEDTCMTDNDGSNNLLFEKSPLCDLYNKRLVQEQAKNVQDLRLLYMIIKTKEMCKTRYDDVSHPPGGARSGG